jgi:hypothetical protein
VAELARSFVDSFPAAPPNRRLLLVGQRLGHQNMVVDRDDPSAAGTHRAGIRIRRDDHTVGAHRPHLGRHTEAPIELIGINDRALFED